MSDLKKLQRDVKATQNEFKKKFIVNDERFNKIFQEDAEDKRKYAEYNKDNNEATDESIESEIIPRKIYNNPTEMTEDLGVDMKNLVFDVLKMIADRKNPLPFIMSDQKKQFSFAILLCILGGLMLFFSNLMRE